jgi:hypothetical protein
MCSLRYGLPAPGFGKTRISSDEDDDSVTGPAVAAGSRILSCDSQPIAYENRKGVRGYLRI